MSPVDDAESKPFPTECPNSSCRLKSAERIRQAKQEWESTVDSLPHLIVLLDGEGRITRANRAVETWGLGAVEAVIGKRMHEVLHPCCIGTECYLESFWQRAQQELAQGLVAGFEAEDPALRRYVHIEMRAHLARGDGTRRAPGGYSVASIQDLTSLRRAEEALRSLNDELDLRVKQRTAELLASNESLQREIEQRARIEQALRESREEYRLLVETMNEGVAIQNAEGVITYVNQRLAEFLGYPREGIIGRLSVEFVDPDSLPRWQDQASRRMRGEDTPYELAFRDKNNRKIFARVSPTPLHQPDGSYAGSFAVFSDITDGVRAESELRLLSAQLMTAQEQERKRIASELHDSIGQGLSAVKFSIENVLRMAGAGAVPESMETLAHLVPRVADMIEEVRRIAMDLRPSTLDDLGILATLGWFCREFQAVYGDLRIDKQIAIREEDVPPPLKTAIYRIVQEAMNNLARHGHADSMHLSLRKVDDRIELLIEDSGAGFDPEAVVLRQGSARGAGLAGMRERAEMTGGTFSLRSQPGVGTRIDVAWSCRDGRCDAAMGGKS